jgi:xanthine dehydrogenase accessory factor
VNLADRLLELARGDERAVLLTVVEGERRGAKLLVLLDRSETVGDAPRCLETLVPEIRRNGLYEHEGLKVFAELYGPPPRLVMIGAVDTCEALCAAAKLLGWRTICIDTRANFLTRERIPSADELIDARPDEGLERVRPDHATAIVVLPHNDELDVPALAAAVRTQAFYVGTIGRRRTRANGRAQLREAGFTDAELARIHEPAGLDVGADSPAETAVSILAEALAARAARPGTPLRTSSGRIHVET